VSFFLRREAGNAHTVVVAPRFAMPSDTGAVVRSLPSLLDEALRDQDANADALAALGEMSLLELIAKLQEGRPVLMAYLKDCGVKAIGARQKIVNTLGKAERAGTLAPYLDEAHALTSGLAHGTSVPHPFARDGASLLANATELKNRGNEAFKSGKSELAVDLYAEAAVAARAAANESGSREAATALSISLHANSAAAYLKLERWEGVMTSATHALDLEPTNPKALYRRAVAYQRLGQRANARKDILQCIKLDPKNKEAREVLASLEAAKEAEKARVRAAFAESVAVEDDGEESEAAIVAAWKAECDRLRLELGRATITLTGMDPEETLDDKVRWDKYDFTPIGLDEFRRKRKEQQKAEREAAAVTGAASPGVEGREAAPDEQLYDRQALDTDEPLEVLLARLCPGVDLSNGSEVRAALRAKGIDPNDLY